MKVQEKRGVVYLQFQALASYPGLFHAFFTRHGGFSAPPFDTLNMSLGLGDDPAAVSKNRKKIPLCAGGGVPVFMDQVHGTDVFVLKKGDGGGESKSPGTVRADAIVTDIRGRILVVQVADCQPVFLYDPVRRVIANIHAGWRGSIHGILQKTVDAMREAFKCRPKDLTACIGPSLGPCCAEFVHFEKEIPPALWGYKDRRHHVDFWGITRDQLIDQGLLRENVHISGLCTRCRTDLFFSYRKEKVTGRFAGVIGLLQEGGGSP